MVLSPVLNHCLFILHNKAKKKNHRISVTEAMGRQPRQRPVSCNFCRVRKLRCSREFPCSNCTSRGVQCQAQDPPRAPGPSSRPVSKRAGGGVSGSGGSGGGGPSSGGKEADILSRLERLEALLAERNKGTDSNSNSHSRTISSAPSSVEGSDVASRTQLEPLQPLPINVQNLTADALWLESSCLGPKPSVSPKLLAPLNKSAHTSYLFRNPYWWTILFSAYVLYAQLHSRHVTSFKTQVSPQVSSLWNQQDASGCLNDMKPRFWFTSTPRSSLLCIMLCTPQACINSSMRSTTPLKRGHKFRCAQFS